MIERVIFILIDVALLIAIVKLKRNNKKFNAQNESWNICSNKDKKSKEITDRWDRVKNM